MRHRRPLVTSRRADLSAPATPLVRRLTHELGKARSGQRRTQARLHEARAALLLSEQRFRSVFSQQFQFMVILSPQGHVLEISEQLLLRDNVVPAEQLIGRLFWETVWWAHAPEMRAVWPERLRKAALATGPLLSEDEFNSSTGEMRVAAAAITAVRNAAGEVDCFVVQGSDITEQKRAESERHRLELELREAHKMQAIGTLAGGIAHDFNNIIGAILGNLALAQQDIGPAHAAQARLLQVRKAGGRARDLVQQILAFSRRQPNELIAQPLLPVVEETLAMLRPTLPPGVALTLRLSELPLWVKADATQVQQVLMNLCMNAAHALGPSGGRIDVGLAQMVSAPAGGPFGDAAAPNGRADLWVRDHGCGMDAATQARIFEPFFTTRQASEGTGLGLSVAHGIVAEHGGSITVESMPGAGSTFHVLLPLTGSSDEPKPAPMLKPVVPRGEGQHVLYVDDDEMMVVMVQGLLQYAGYRVTTCRDAPTAVAAVRADPAGFDAVVTDFNMPFGSGLDVALAVRALRPGLPVVISSGFLSDELCAAAENAGVRHLLRKENTVEELCDMLRQVLLRPGTDATSSQHRD